MCNEDVKLVESTIENPTLKYDINISSRFKMHELVYLETFGETLDLNIKFATSSKSIEPLRFGLFTATETCTNVLYYSKAIDFFLCANFVLSCSTFKDSRGF